ncbi:MAG: zf-TFIIB domain-containing protein [Thermodesulfobacteriota bacterium]
MAANKKKICPFCSGVLKEVYAEANYGRVLLLDQCRLCGGLWFDRWELYLLKPKEALRLDALDLEALKTGGHLLKGSGNCPLCRGETLREFKDPVLPADASIMRCPHCSGLWLSRGELTKYAAKRASSRGETLKKRPKTDDLTALKTLQKALDASTIAGASAAPLLPDYSPIPPRELAKDLAPVILQILFKLIFKF